MSNQHIFLTGATGILGLEVLPRLLHRFPFSTVSVLVRAENDEAAWKRRSDLCRYLAVFHPGVDTARIEVLRGPQGTLFGSGSASGTVRYISNQPRIGVSESVAEFTLSSIDDGDIGGSAKVAINAPIGDTAALRVAAYYTSYGGYMDAIQPNLSVDKDVNSGDRTGVRLAIRTEPNDRLTVTPRIIYQELDMDGWNRIDDFNILANPFTTTRPTVTFGERQLFTQFARGEGGSD